MSNIRKNIKYFRDPETGLLITRVGAYIAVPVIDLLKTLPQKDGSLCDFKEQFPLKKYDVISVSKWYISLILISKKDIRKRYTREWINYHREFWGLKVMVTPNRS